MSRLLAVLALILVALPVFAQGVSDEKAAPDQEKSWFVGFVEKELSTPNRKIGISNIEGVLSSKATIGEITIADRKGVWLRIENASIDWNRSALLLRRLSINKLSADRIDMLRRPLPAKGAPTPESSSFRLPELPLAVELQSLDIGHVTFAKDVFGLAADLAATGRLELAGGSLDTALAIRRLDGPGGHLSLAAKYANDSGRLDLDAELSEPQDGVVANLLDIEGRPPVHLTVKGSGPVNDLDLSLALDAAGNRVLTGTTMLRRGAGGLGFTADLDGPIAALLPPRFRDFFGAGVELSVSGLVRNGGGVAVKSIKLSSAALSLAGSAETSADGFLTQLKLDARLAGPNGQKVLLPMPGDNTVEKAAFNVDYGGAAGNQWTGVLDVTGLSTESFDAGSVVAALGGVAENLDQPGNRHLTFLIKGKASGVAAQSADVARALGRTIDLDIEGGWRSAQPVKLAKALLSANGLSLSLSGAIADYAFDGDIAVDAASIAPFSQAAGRTLAGALRLDAKGRLRPLSGAFDLALDGSASGLSLGEAALDNLLQGTTRISGRLARDEHGLKADKLRIGNKQAELTADGTFATGAADFNFAATLSDLALVSDKASGRLEATGRAAGSNGRIALSFTAKIPHGRLVGKTLDDATVDFDGALANGDVTGKIAGAATLAGAPVKLSSGIAVAGGVRRLQDLDFSAGATHVTGDLAQDAKGLYSGRLSLASSDISTAAALALVEASGGAHADIDLSEAGGRQNATVAARLNGLVMGPTKVGSADLRATVDDLFGVPVVDGSARASAVNAGGVAISSLAATASSKGGSTDFSADARLENGATLEAGGSLAPEKRGYRLSLARAKLAQDTLTASLARPASMLVEGQNLTIDKLALDIGGGRVEIDGKVADTLDLAVSIKALPLAIANAVRPDFALAGIIDGNAKVTGSRAKPDAKFSLHGRSISAAALRDAGLSALSVDAEGTSNGDRLTLDASLTSPQGLHASFKGSLPLGGGQLTGTADLNALPLAALNGVVKGQKLGGVISGTARLSGTLADPAADFTLKGSKITAAPLANAGLSTLDLAASGRYAGRTVALSAATLRNAQGLNLSLSGRAPLSGGGLDLSVSGQAPLAVAGRFLADRGTQLSGAVRLKARVTGSLKKPSVSGAIATHGAEIVDPQTNLRLRDINVAASIAGDRIAITSASAAFAHGGALKLAGELSIDAAAGMPANLSITLDKAHYSDGVMIAATLSGKLTVTGALLADPLIAGRITIEKAEISVPEHFGGGISAVDVKHVGAPRAVRQTLARARANDGTPMPTARPAMARLDIAVSAPNRFFVRGRGLDAELGGHVRLTGPAADIRPVGAFRLIRGRLSIVGQRIDFDEGTVTLIGDLDPMINFVARSQGQDITVTINVTGRASDPKIVFSSQPQLPQDEVLARLIFKRSIGDLSPLQIAQLAAAAAELAGGSHSSLLEKLRKATGLDDLDIVTDTEGKTAVRAGRYIEDNIYLGVEAGVEGEATGTVNLDITRHLKAKGSLGTDGDTGMGIYFEKDY